MEPIYRKAMRQRRNVLEGFRWIATITGILLTVFIMVACLVLPGVHFDKKFDRLQGELIRVRLELEIIHSQQRELREQVDELIEGQETWMERLEVKRARVTAYAPLDPRAVEGMCYSGDPTVTASGAETTPGLTIAAGRHLPFGTKVWIEGIGWRVVQDRGGRVQNSFDVAVWTREEAYAIGNEYRRVLIFN